MKPVVAYRVVSAARGWDAKLAAHAAADAAGVVRVFPALGQGAKAAAAARAAALTALTKAKWRVTEVR